MTSKWGGWKRRRVGLRKRQSISNRHFGGRRERLIAERWQFQVSRAHAAAAAIGHGAHRGMAGGVFVAFAHAGGRHTRAGLARRVRRKPSYRRRKQKKHREARDDARPKYHLFAFRPKLRRALLYTALGRWTQSEILLLVWGDSRNTTQRSSGPGGRLGGSCRQGRQRHDAVCRREQLRRCFVEPFILSVRQNPPPT